MADNFDAAERTPARSAAEDHAALEKKRAEIRREVEVELENEIAAVKELRESTEAVRRKLMRENRTTSYRADKAEQRAETLQREVDELRDQVSSLLSERDELRNTLPSDSLPEADNESDGEPINTHFPCDAGKGIRFIVFGGSQGWIAEQRRRFPHIDFYDSDILPNPSIIANADILMLNTFVMTHTYFNIIQDAAKKNHISVRYFTSRGINNGSAQIKAAYEEYLAAGVRCRGA